LVFAWYAGAINKLKVLGNLPLIVYSSIYEDIGKENCFEKVVDFSDNIRFFPIVSSK